MILLLRRFVTTGALTFLSVLLADPNNVSAQTPVTYPDIARVERSTDFLFWDYTLRRTDTDSTVFGPDAPPLIFAERDSVTLMFGEHSSAIVYRAATLNALASGGAYRVIAAGAGARYYSGTNNPNPGAYDHKIWPGITGASFTGTDGHLYRIAYQEFQAWTVRDGQGQAVYNCPDPATTTLEGGLERCWYNAFVLTRSTDGGTTWALAGSTPASYLVASSPYRFQQQQNLTRHGAFPGANGLFKVGGFYYFPVTIWGEGFQIATMMRTNDITNASSWRYWDGEAFTLPNTDAYAQTVADPESLLPAPFDETTPILLNQTMAPVEGLARSSYFNAYIRTVVRAYNSSPEVKPGVYFELSKDGFNWSGPTLLYPLSNATLLASGVKVGGRSENFAYPVIVSDQLPSSESIGETAWLAYVTFNPQNPGSADRDLRMVQVRFATREITGFTVSHKNLTIPEDASPGDGYCDNGYGRCSLVTALDESNHRLPWLPDTLKLRVTIFSTFSGDLIEPYLPVVRKPISLDFRGVTGYTANSLLVDAGFDGTFGPRIQTLLTFGQGSNGSHVKGVSIGNLVLGDYGVRTSVTVSGSRIDSLSIYGDGNRIGGVPASERNLIGMLVVDGMDNRIDANLIGDLGIGNMTTDRSTAPVSLLASGNDLIGNVIGGTDYRTINVTGEEASDNRIIDNTIGVLPWNGQSVSSGGAAIAIVNGERNQIEDNTIAFAGSEGGLFLLDAVDNVFIGNEIRDHLGSGLVLSGSSRGNRIGAEGDGNQIHANGGYGIDRLALWTEGNPLIANAIFGNTAGAISNPGFDPTPAPKLISAFLNPTNDSLTIRYGSMRGVELGQVTLELFGNPDSESVQAVNPIAGSRHSWSGDRIGSHRVAVSETFGNVVLTATDASDETSGLSLPMTVLASGQGPVAVSDSTQLRRTHNPSLRVETVSVRIRNTGAQPLRFEASAGSSWVGIDGTQPFEVAPSGHYDLSVTLDSRNASGVIRDTLHLTTNEEARYRIVIPVAVTINNPTVGLSVLPDTLKIEVPRPQSETTIQRTVRIALSGNGTIPWNITKNQPWITSLMPQSGTLTTGETASVTVSIRIQPTDALGTRTAMLVVFASIGGVNVPHEVPVTLTLTNPTSIDDQAERPTMVKLHPATPNPFNPSTVIRYELPEAMPVRMELYTVNGMRIRVLVDGTQAAGTHAVTVDGSQLASGVYLYRMVAGDRVLTGRMTLLK